MFHTPLAVLTIHFFVSPLPKIIVSADLRKYVVIFRKNWILERTNFLWSFTVNYFWGLYEVCIWEKQSYFIFWHPFSHGWWLMRKLIYINTTMLSKSVMWTIFVYGWMFYMGPLNNSFFSPITHIWVGKTKNQSSRSSKWCAWGCNVLFCAK